ncbi:MAG TPA: hypothetical protein VLE50_07420 [Cellvibrio sp.]|nr:hypothetical protein [Cellvibrio sp.]
MGKDNLDIQRIVTNLTTDKLDAARDNVQQQMLTALCLMVVGLVLAVTGFVGVVLKLGHFARINILFAGRFSVALLLNRKRIQKTTLAD